MAWTADQSKAIETHGKNLLVSAAAGSGKTAVLVERIIKMILDGTCDIDRMLVVTFTNAAAAEMRSRIHAALAKKISEGGEPDTLDRLERQSILLSGASIMTVHAFCQMLLRRYFSKIDLDPKFRAADEHELNIFQQEIVEEVFERQYADDDPDVRKKFQRFTDEFGGNEHGDAALHELILDLYATAQSHPDPEGWLRSLPFDFDVPVDADITQVRWYDEAKAQIIFELDAAYDECMLLQKVFGADTPSFLNDDRLAIGELRRLFQIDWQHLFDAINRKKIFVTLPRGLDETLKQKVKQLRDNGYKARIKRLQKEYFFAPPERLIEDLRAVRPSIETLVDVTIEFAEAFSSAKRERCIIDFNDMEHLALKILDDKNIRAGLRRRYETVMIDEYQDTNAVQEAIMQSIARDDNLFVVGDVKQSIYRFRLADPTLFMKKYDEYPARDDCERIELSMNFRSRAEVIDAVNFVFERLMRKDAVEIDYTDDARLNCGADYPTVDGKTLDTPTKLHLITSTSEPNADFDVRGAGGVGAKASKIKLETQSIVARSIDGTTLNTPTELHLITSTSEPIDDAPDEETIVKTNADFDVSDSGGVGSKASKIELETQLIANRIKKFMSDGTVIFDKELKNYRRLEYRDIVILLRSAARSTGAILDVLKRNKIPGYSAEEETYFRATEIQVIVSMLTVLDNARQDVPLTAVMLSPIGGFSAEELARLKLISPFDDFYTLLTTAAMDIDGGIYNLPTGLPSKARIFLQNLNRWRDQSMTLSVPELLSTIYRETKYYEAVGSMGDGMQRQANLRMLIDRAAAYEQTAFRGLSRFLQFIKKIRELNNDLKSARTLGENENVVRIMTIHKSKGLEFPIVFVADLGHGFNIKDDTASALLKHRELGAGPYRMLEKVPVKTPTLARRVIGKRCLNELIAEELRILYVAMTRAREKLILVGSIKESNLLKYEHLRGLDRLKNFTVLDARSFLDWLMMALTAQTISIKTFKIESKKIILGGAVEEEPTVEPPTLRAEPTIAPMVEGLSVPAKMSVTEIKRRFASDDETAVKVLATEKFYRRPNFEREKKMTGLEYGVAMHSVMQHLDLDGDLTVDGIDKQIASMVERKILSSEVAQKIRRSDAARFFESEFGRRMLRAEEIYRELPFNMLIEPTELNRLLESEKLPPVDEKIFVQGIIDVLFRDAGGPVLIDYKTDRDADEETIRQKYRLQIELYGRAVETILNRAVDEKYIFMLSTGNFIDMRGNAPRGGNISGAAV